MTLRDGSFESDWLQLREPFDHDARASGLAESLGRSLAKAIGPDTPARLLDLGGGTGSNFRYLAPRLMGAQSWTLLDRDPALLDRVAALTGEWAGELGMAAATEGSAVTVGGWSLKWRQRDLREPKRLLKALDEARAEGLDAVVTSALLDLAGAPWLMALADWCVAHKLPLLAALTVDGRLGMSPADPRDSSVHAWFKDHQRSDQGSGPNPGPQSAQLVGEALEAKGFSVRMARADWHIPSDEPEMLRAMLDGLAGAAAEMCQTPEVVTAWQQARHQEVDAGNLSITVGHLDLLALP